MRCYPAEKCHTAATLIGAHVDYHQSKHSVRGGVYLLGEQDSKFGAYFVKVREQLT